MPKKRSLKLDVCALGLLALSVFLGIALFTYDKADPPSTLVYPPQDTFHNACGFAGAYAAHHLLETMGVGAHYLVGSLVVVTLLLLVRREINQPVVRVGGWLVSLVGLTTLFALALPNFTPGPIIGAGGYIGAIGRNLLEQHFAMIGAYIFALTVLLAGLLLCTDYLMFQLAATTTIASGKGLARVGRLGRSVASRRPKTDLESGVKTAAELHDEEDDEDDQWEYEDEEYEEDDEEEYDEDEYEEEDETEDEPAPIKVRTPKQPGRNASADQSDSDQAAPQETSPAVEAASHGGLAAGIKSALGIKARPAERPAASPPPPKKSEREEIIERLEAADHEPCPDYDYELPPLDLLLPSDDICYDEQEREVRRKAKILQRTFKNFGFNVRVVEIETGPVIAQYEVQLEAGLRLSKITGLADDLAIALRVPSVRIVAPIPGKNTVGIEVPNERREIVRLREVIEESNGRAKRMKIPIYLGKDVAGNPLVIDLTTLPHLLIAGRTGTGKSVCLNSIIVSILMGRGPDEVRMLMIDPKMVELSGYQKLPHLMHPVVTDMRKAEAILAWAVDKMEERYQLLARAGVRHVSVYNQLGDEELRDRIRPRSETEWEEIPRQLPFIVIVADELADLMMTAGKDVEQHIIRLAQKSRAVGIHLILATQKPTVDVITGLIKSNLPARIAFQVASRTDSRVVLDEMGAEKLLGNGDMLFLSPGTSQLLRGQGTFLSDDEITAVVDFVGVDDPQFAHELLELKTKDELEAAAAGTLKNRDELYEAAVDIVVRERRGSVSLLQRALGIGYGRAARLIDFMAEDHIVGEYNGSQARDVLISLEEWEAMSKGNAAEEAPPAAPPTAATAVAGSITPRRTNRIIPNVDEPSDLEDEETDADEQDSEYEEREDEDDEYEDEESEGDEWEAEDDDEWEYEDDEDAPEDDEEEEYEDDELADDEEWEYEEEDECEEEELADHA